MDIRVATPDDWPVIYTFFEQIVDEGRAYAFPAGLTEQTAAGWWMEDPPGQTVVAVDGDIIVGSAKMGPNRPSRGAHIATASFMVDPAHQGRGVGRLLGDYVGAWGRHQGYHGMQFNAVESNTAAVTLWKRLGFTVIGTVPEAFDHAEHGYVGLHVMFQKF